MPERAARRRREVSRIETFSDAVFAFALTLLVVSLEVPRSFVELVETMEGFLAFAICFAFIVWVWFEHYLFFRRFGLEDGVTIVLNALLLFVVLFYVYPLKFLFTGLVQAWTGLGEPRAGDGDSIHGRALLLVYGLGFVAVFAGLALLYVHAWRRRRELDFDAMTLHYARAGVLRHGVTASVGIAAILLAMLLPDRLIGFAGLFYSVLGPVHGLLGYRLARRRAALLAAPAALEAPRPPAPPNAGLPPPAAR